MWQVIVGILLGLLGIFILLIAIYIVSGIQAKAWIDVLDKYIGDKLNKKQKIMKKKDCTK